MYVWISQCYNKMYLNEWVRPYLDISSWEMYDLSCVSRDQSDDQVLKDAIKAGKRIGILKLTDIS